MIFRAHMNCFNHYQSEDFLRSLNGHADPPEFMWTAESRMIYHILSMQPNFCMHIFLVYILGATTYHSNIGVLKRKLTSYNQG